MKTISHGLYLVETNAKTTDYILAPSYEGALLVCAQHFGDAYSIIVTKIEFLGYAHSYNAPHERQ